MAKFFQRRLVILQGQIHVGTIKDMTSQLRQLIHFLLILWGEARGQRHTVSRRQLLSLWEHFLVAVDRLRAKFLHSSLLGPLCNKVTERDYDLLLICAPNTHSAKHGPRHALSPEAIPVIC